MKIDLSQIDQAQFNLKTQTGDDLFLVYPKVFSPNWNDTNKIYRSSIWNSIGNPVSLGYKKFVNLGEKPEFEPVNLNSSINFIQKIDGTCLIVSKYKQNLIIRTRQSFDTLTLPNGSEIDYLKKKYPKAFDNHYVNSCGFSVIFEWVSPSNIIVLKESSEPELYLTNIIYHCGYYYASQKELDIIAKDMGVKRPQWFNFKNVDESLSFCENNKEIEGFVLYFNNDQILKKIKTPYYLKLHQFKSNASLKNTVDLFFEYNCPDFSEFKTILLNKFDYECFLVVEPYIKQIIENYQRVIYKELKIVDFVRNIAGLPRREQAFKIKEKYGPQASLGFQLLDSNSLAPEQRKKLLFSFLSEQENYAVNQK